MIRSLSPYYITIPWQSPLSGEIATKVLIKIYVWNGLKSEIPENATYEVTRENATNSETNFKLNIANWIADFIEIEQQSTTTTELIDGNNQQWFKFETYYTTSEENDLIYPTNQTTELFARGYNYGMDGENSQVETGFLIPVAEYKISPNSSYCIPYLRDYTVDSGNTPEVTLTINSLTKDVAPDSSLYNLDYTKVNDTQTIYLETSISGANDYNGTLPNVVIEITEDSPTDINLFLGANGDYDVRLTTYDPNYNTMVTSNFVTITFTL